MAIQKITIEEFADLHGSYPILDVRSSGEYKEAHIPGAYNLPLFSNEERKVVGIAYKRESKQNAIKTGLKYFGVKMVQMLDEAERIIEAHYGENSTERPKEKRVIIHCWRGGMRSAGVAWLLGLYGFDVYTIIGGYKSFRTWCIDQFYKEYRFKILGGYTGSGKTEILKQLALTGSAVIDLEALANHKGSAFGHLGQNEQPTQEMFENHLALALYQTSSASSIWLEDESRRIGSIHIPAVLYATIKSKAVYFLQIPFEERLKYLIATYGIFEREKLAESILRIKKRLGGLETKIALQHLEAGDIKNCFKILLNYYDKYYLKCLEQKNDQVRDVKRIPIQNINAVENAVVLKEIEQQTIARSAHGISASLSQF